jgi:type VI secretion system protein ImpM
MPAICWHCAGVTDAPGFYGKAVTRGDFLSRRLPSGFAAAWDGWLQGMVGAARAKLGEAWLDAFLTMPVWHFVLGRGIAGPDPVLGVLIPSVDRVGRYFPFTILGRCVAGGVPAAEWTARVERLALGALEDDFDPKALDAALVALGSPLLTTDVPADGESVWWGGGTALRTENLPEGSWLMGERK